MKLSRLALVAILALAAAPAFAQTAARTYTRPDGSPGVAIGVQCVDPTTGNWCGSAASPSFVQTGQMAPTSVRSASLTTSASTALAGAAATTKPSYLKVSIETALTAPLFLCLNAQACSATVYDEMLPSGATVGTRLFVERPFISGVNYFTTATAVINVTRWNSP